jgi:ribosomal protein RSM22 (predicted rRNA methylase)
LQIPFQYGTILPEKLKNLLTIMFPPDNLLDGIETETEGVSLNDLLKTWEGLSQRYRSGEGGKKGFLTNDLERYAYLHSRVPATFAACRAVFQEIPLRLPHLVVKSLLDLGAGPGTAMWSAATVFPELEKVSLIEKDQAFIEIGKNLASGSDQPAVQKASWECGDLESFNDFSPHDLTIFSYSIGELSPGIRKNLLQNAFHASQALIIIEPGTPVGFERIRLMREELIQFGGHIVAPCPHANACPMANGNWCHFSARTTRTSWHRQLKGGYLGYEDEKFSYLIVSKDEPQIPKGRVIRHPIKRPGHILFSLCTDEGLKEETLSKKHGERYKESKKCEWGNEFPC